MLNYSIFLTAFELVVALYIMTVKPDLLPCVVAVLLGAGRSQRFSRVWYAGALNLSRPKAEHTC